MKWVMEMNAASHQCNNKEELMDVEYYVNNGLVRVKGHIPWRRDDNTIVKVPIQNVRIAQELKYNILSLGIIIEKGFQVQFRANNCEIYRNNVMVLKGKWIMDHYEVITDDHSKAKGQPQETSEIERDEVASTGKEEITDGNGRIITNDHSNDKEEESQETSKPIYDEMTNTVKIEEITSNNFPIDTSESQIVSIKNDELINDNLCVVTVSPKDSNNMQLKQTEPPDDPRIISTIPIVNELTEKLFLIANMINGSHLNPHDSEFLIYGYLLCLSLDNFEKSPFVTVEDHDLMFLIICLVIFTLKCESRCERGILYIHLIKPNIPDFFKPTFTAGESTAYFEAYQNILEGLQELNRLFLLVDDYKKCVKNAYVRPPNFPMNETCYMKNYFMPILKINLWRSCEKLCLNESQFLTFSWAVIKGFAFIQGLPVWEKFYIGKGLMQTLFKRLDHISSVVCNWPVNYEFPIVFGRWLIQFKARKILTKLPFEWG